MLGAGVWLVARALVPPSRPLRTLSAELVAPRVEHRTSERGGRAPAGGIAWRAGSATGTSARLAADLAVLGRTPTRHTLDKLGYAAALRSHRPRAGGAPADSSTPASRRCRWCSATLLFAGRRVVLPRRRGPVAGRRDAPRVGAGADRLRRHRRHLAGRRRRRRGGADGRRRSRLGSAVRASSRRRCAPPRRAGASCGTPSMSSASVPTSSRCASWRRPSTWPPSRARGSARRCSPRPTPCASASSPRPKRTPSGRRRRWASRRR